MQNILITGADGFVGKNLIATLRQTCKNCNLQLFDIKNMPNDLLDFVHDTDFVLHLADLNAPHNFEGLATENVNLTEHLVSVLLTQCSKTGRSIPLVMLSSTQVALEYTSGRSKHRGETAIFSYGALTGTPVYVYRLPTVFGKWCQPDCNNAVATICHNIANGLPVTMNDPNVVMELVYIDDVVVELLRALKGKANRINDFCHVPIKHTISLGEIINLIISFRDSRATRLIPNMSDAFTKKLYSTYLSYLPEDQFSYPLKMNIDNRGSFTEFLKTPDCGQVSINVLKPGIVKGNHWHQSINKKFLVVSGLGIIRFRRVDSDKVIEYFVSGDKYEVLDIPIGYTYNIENLGTSDLVTVIWANEIFNPEKLDAIPLEV